MTSFNPPARDELAELRAELAQLKYDLDGHRAPRKARVRWRRRTTVVASVVAALSTIAGVAVAATGSTTNVSFVSLATPFKVATGATIAAGKQVSYAISGGSTSVPTDATTVRLSVSVKGTRDGDLNFYPAGNISGGSGQFLEWTAGGTATGVIMENVGSSNKLTVSNSSAASASFTATITGYSTQVTAGDINGTGGASGQVLTDDGAGGATWQNPSAGGPAGGVLAGNYPNPGLGAGVVATTNLAANAVGNANLQSGSVTTAIIANGSVTGPKLGAGSVTTSTVADNSITAQKISSTGGSSGQLLTNDGPTVSWQTHGQGFASAYCCQHDLSGSLSVVDQLTVPQGQYLISAAAEYSGANDDIGCVINTASKQASRYTQAITGTSTAFGYNVGPLSAQVLVSNPIATTYYFECYAYTSASSTNPFIYTDELTATQLDSATGTFFTP